jgi:hypothetical protein
MSGLFGRKKEAPAPKISESIMILRQAQETLQKRQTHLEKQCQIALQEAKARMKAGDKRGKSLNSKT